MMTIVIETNQQKILLGNRFSILMRSVRMIDGKSPVLAVALIHHNSRLRRTTRSQASIFNPWRVGGNR